MKMLLESLELTPWPEVFTHLYRQKGYWQGKALGELLRDSADKFADKVAVIDTETSLSYGELDYRANQLAAGFLSLGLQQQDKVIVQLPNTAQLLEVMFALFRIGVVPILALPAHRGIEIRSFIEQASPKAVVVVDQFNGFDYRPFVREVMKGSSIENVIVVGDQEEFVSIDDLYRKPLELPCIDASQMALLQLSGGTTSVPKLIPRTHDDYFYSVRESCNLCALDESSVYMAVLPAVHNFILSSPGVLGALFMGATVVFSATPAPDTCFGLIEKYRVTHCSLVPPLVISWLSYEEFFPCVGKTDLGINRVDVSSMKVLQVGGSKLSIEIAKKVKPLLNCQLQQVFGMAEGLVNYTPLDEAQNVIETTQGKPISLDDEIRIVDEEDRLVSHGCEGHLLTRGPYTIRGYYKSPEHNAKVFTEDGYYRTGDLVRLTPEGYLMVTGRSKDQINRGGEKVSAESLENHLLAHPGVKNASVVAMPDPYLGEKICAFIIPSGANKLSLEHQKISLPRLRSYLRNRGLAEFALPDRIEVIDKLPKTHLGKICKKNLRQLISNKLDSLSEQLVTSDHN